MTNSARLKDLPARSVDLLEALDAMYPPSPIKRGESVEDAHRRAGRRELIDELLALRDATGRRIERSLDRKTVIT